MFEWVGCYHVSNRFHICTFTKTFHGFAQVGHLANHSGMQPGKHGGFELSSHSCTIGHLVATACNNINFQHPAAKLWCIGTCLRVQCFLHRFPATVHSMLKPHLLATGKLFFRAGHSGSSGRVPWVTKATGG